ncbi:MAG: hypothetical protein DRN81_04905 [Thermoproteota archaeon]|nr:MAG: hypothetical protein DRN81_04905 [Candidatus Korarchaeota archaeon]
MKYAIRLSNEVEIVNCTIHDLQFEDGTIVKPCGFQLMADIEEIPVETHDNYKIIRLSPKPTMHGLKELEIIRKNHPNAIIIGNVLSARAYLPYVKRCIYKKGHPGEHICRIDKFVQYPEGR